MKSKSTCQRGIKVTLEQRIICIKWEIRDPLLIGRPHNPLTLFNKRIKAGKRVDLENSESVSHLSAGVSCPVTAGGHGEKGGILYDDRKKRKAVTYGGCAEKPYEADNIFHQRLWSQRRLQEGKGREGSDVPSGIQQAVTHLIYLYLRTTVDQSVTSLYSSPGLQPERLDVLWPDKAYVLDGANGCPHFSSADLKTVSILRRILWTASLSQKEDAVFYGPII